MVASRSRTRPGTGWPAAVEAGRPPRVSACCAQATSRAAPGPPAAGQRRRVQAGQQPPRGRRPRRPARTGRPGHAARPDRRSPRRRRRASPPDRPRPGPDHARRAAAATRQRLTEPAGQPGRVGEIGQQPGAGVTDHTPPTTGNNDLGTRPGTLHLESAFRAERWDPQTSPIVPRSEGTSAFPAHPWTALNEGPRLTKGRG